MQPSNRGGPEQENNCSSCFCHPSQDDMKKEHTMWAYFNLAVEVLHSPRKISHGSVQLSAHQAHEVRFIKNCNYFHVASRMSWYLNAFLNTGNSASKCFMHFMLQCSRNRALPQLLVANVQTTRIFIVEKSLHSINIAVQAKSTYLIQFRLWHGGRFGDIISHVFLSAWTIRLRAFKCHLEPFVLMPLISIGIALVKQRCHSLDFGHANTLVWIWCNYDRERLPFELQHEIYLLPCLVANMMLDEVARVCR